MSILANTKFHPHIPSQFHLEQSSALYLAHTIRNFALSLVGIFIPIYILDLAEPIAVFHQDALLNGLLWIMLYFLIRSAMVWLTAFAMTNAVFIRLKLKGAIAFSNFLLILQIILWYWAGTEPVVIFLAAAVDGICTYLYWVPYHLLFARRSKGSDGHYGKEVGMRTFLVQLSSALGPIMGGFVISQWGFDPLFAVSIVLIMAAVLPILVSVTEEHHAKHDPEEIVRKFFGSRKLIRINLALWGSGMDAIVYGAFGPVLLSMILQDFVRIGSISSLSLFLSAVTVLVIGGWVDKYGGKLIQAIGSSLNALFSLFRVFVSTPFAMYFLDVADRLNGAMYGLPFMTMVYDKSAKLGDANFTIHRELLIHLSIIATCSLMIVILPILPSWRWVFIVASVGSLMTYLIATDEN